MYVLRKIFYLVSFFILLAPRTHNCVIPLTKLKGFSSSIPQEYRVVSPILGALCYTYAKNLSCLGHTDSESVIMLHQLFGSDLCSNGIIHIKSMRIGHYLEPSHIGQIVGIVHLRQQDSIDEAQFIHHIKSILKDITKNKCRTIKDEIINDLKQTITHDNAQYLTYEEELLNSCTKEERKELRELIKSLAHTWNNEREALVINKINNTHQKSLLSSLKNLHKKIAKNRSLLDLESKSTAIENPLFKDSMGAFIHGLIGSLKEEGTLYPLHNTTNLLLAFLWHTANNQDDLYLALQSYAQIIGSTQKICLNTQISSYTDKDIKQLQTVSQDTVLTQPLEDIVYIHHICMNNQQQGQHSTASCAHMTTYFNAYVHALKQTDTEHAKDFALPYLVALYAPDWNSVQTLHHTIIYCRCMIQSLDNPHDRLDLMHAIGNGHINTQGMADHYIHLLTELYQSLPTTFEIQNKAFDILMYASMHPTPYTENLHLSQLFTHLVKSAIVEDAKAAIACTLLDYIQSDGIGCVGQKDFDTHAYIISTLQSLKNDTLKAFCIAHIAQLVVQKKFDAAFSDDLTQCAHDMLETLHDKNACYIIIKSLININYENKKLHQLLKTLYTWTIDKLDHMLDDTHKAAIFNQILDQYTTHVYPNNKHSQLLLSHITQKTLASIHTE